MKLALSPESQAALTALGIVLPSDPAAAKATLAALKAALKTTVKPRGPRFRFETDEREIENEDGSKSVETRTVLRISTGKRGQQTKLSAAQVAEILRSDRYDAVSSFADGETDVEALMGMLPDEPAETDEESE